MSPLGGVVFVPGKGRQKGPLAGWCTVASYAMATSRRQPLKKWRYVTDKAHSHSPLGNQVEDWAPPLCRRWGGEKEVCGKGIVGPRRYSASSGRINVQGDRKSFV